MRMLTPIELQAKVFKTGIGYDKKDVEAFIREVIKSYEHLYKENMELNEKLAVLSEGMQYYKNLEKTLQKTLVVAQKTAQDTENTAKNNALMIEKEAKAKARELVYDAKKELDRIQIETTNLIQQYEKYKAQYKQLATTQLEYLSSGVFELSYSPINLKNEMEPIGLEVTNSEDMNSFPQEVESPENTKEVEDTQNHSEEEVTPNQVSPSEEESIMSILQHAAVSDIEKEAILEQSDVVKEQVANEPLEGQENQVQETPQPVYVEKPQEIAQSVYVEEPQEMAQPVYVEKPQEVPQMPHEPQESSSFNNTMNQTDATIQDRVLSNERLEETPIPVNQLVDELLDEDESPVIINVQNESIQSSSTSSESADNSSSGEDHKKSKFSLFSNLLFREEDKEDKPEVHLSHEEDYVRNYQRNESQEEITREETIQEIKVPTMNAQEVNINNISQTPSVEHIEESDDDDFGFEFIDLDD